MLHAPYGFYLILLFHEHMYVNWHIIRMWVEKEGALGRKESDRSLFKALLITFPIEDSLIIALRATEIKRSLLGCTGSPSRWIQQHSASASRSAQAQLWSKCFVLNAFHVLHTKSSSGFRLNHRIVCIGKDINHPFPPPCHGKEQLT